MAARSWTPAQRAQQAAAIQRHRPWLKARGPVSAAGKAASARNADRGGDRKKIRAETKALNAVLRKQRSLLDDLRGMASSNALVDRHPLRRDTLARAAGAFAARADADGRVRERFDLVFLTGWAPSPDQPKPARRGSASASLAAALRGGGGSASGE